MKLTPTIPFTLQVASVVLLVSLFTACDKSSQKNTNSDRIVDQPILTTQQVTHDSDDPALWIHPDSPDRSLILGTDKEVGGGLMVFTLDGNIIDSLSIKGLHYPNNVDVAYNVRISDSMTTDIAVVSEREKHRIRIFSLPQMKPLDHGGLEVFLGDSLRYRRPMGVALFKKPGTNTASVFVSRKEGPIDGYIAQYQLVPDSTNHFSLRHLRNIGSFSGTGEIEAIMVDNELGFLYYADEAFGIRKYYADPANGSNEILVFGKNHFAEDREGIALWKGEGQKGKIVVSNQQDHSFNIYDRQAPHNLIGKWYGSTIETDGCEIYAGSLPPSFPNGIFVAMSDDRTFHCYDLQQLNQAK